MDRPLVLLRGLIREQRHWGRILTLLDERLSKRIICIDIPGNGQYFKEDSPETIQAMTDWVTNELDRYGVEEAIDILSISMGGMIAADMMERYPSKVNSAVLINSSMKPYSPFYYRLKVRIYPKIIRALFSKASQREKLILSMTSNRYCENHLVQKKWVDWQKECPVKQENVLRQLRAAAQFKCVHKPKQPVLILSSVKDQMVNHECSVALARAWQVDIHTHQSAGHDIPLDDPEWVLEQVVCWLEKQSVGDVLNSNAASSCVV
ncbi:alpha/beta hydrolase [Vibrio sp. Of7-15]|uniref:alpha/beta fold hydrolase n=1 Tax=Vibrio sp. Of7-15 TaxID=2724879 RepID=UPI001EF391A8|nr:alpha/beta hydrolase [Vibrio sp. Of7-15]MCG7499450.1 alpha/beta hydrolase [Vibrio sp. Of7-15]